MISVKTKWLRDSVAVPGDVLLCAMGRRLLRYLERGFPEMGISLKPMIEALDEIRLALIRTHEGHPASPASTRESLRAGSGRGRSRPETNAGTKRGPTCHSKAGGGFFGFGREHGDSGVPASTPRG